jgi:hypothetical protein
MMFICETCGTQNADLAAAPESCPICVDDRQYIGAQGQRWTTMEELTADHAVVFEDDDGVLAMRMTPSFAINQRALLIPADCGNILWESLSLVTDDAVAELARQGGVSFIAISHPHFFSAMVSWSEALGGVPILLHEAHREWVQRPSPLVRFWSGDEHVLSPDVTLIRTGGHFPGSTALHWKRGPRPGGSLFSGDAPQVAADRRGVSFMYSYPNYIPMHPDRVRSMQLRLRPYDFDDVFGYSIGRNIIGDGRGAVDRSFARYLRAIGAEGFAS